MKTIKQIREEADEVRRNIRSPFDRAIFNASVLLDPACFSEPTKDNNVFKASNIAYKHGARPADNPANPDDSEGYRTPIMFGDYVDYMMHRVRQESLEDKHMELVESLEELGDEDLEALFDLPLSTEATEEILEWVHWKQGSKLIDKLLGDKFKRKEDEGHGGLATYGVRAQHSVNVHTNDLNGIIGHLDKRLGKHEGANGERTWKTAKHKIGLYMSPKSQDPYANVLSVVHEEAEQLDEGKVKKFLDKFSYAMVNDHWPESDEAVESEKKRVALQTSARKRLRRIKRNQEAKKPVGDLGESTEVVQRLFGDKVRVRKASHVGDAGDQTHQASIHDNDYDAAVKELNGRFGKHMEGTFTRSKYWKSGKHTVALSSNGTGVYRHNLRIYKEALNEDYRFKKSYRDAYAAWVNGGSKGEEPNPSYYGIKPGSKKAQKQRWRVHTDPAKGEMWEEAEALDELHAKGKLESIPADEGSARNMRKAALKHAAHWQKEKPSLAKVYLKGSSRLRTASKQDVKEEEIPIDPEEGRALYRIIMGKKPTKRQRAVAKDFANEYLGHGNTELTKEGKEIEEGVVDSLKAKLNAKKIKQKEDDDKRMKNPFNKRLGRHIPMPEV